VLLVTAPFALRALRAVATESKRPAAAFPWWGWFGIALTGTAWVLAWNRFGWFAHLQPFTFTPLWIGYILTINALTCRRTGHCWLRDRPRCFIALFPASAVFWWYFEYLNRYVRNWHYVGVGELAPFDYLVQATLPFATVLPAVLATTEWLATFSGLSSAFVGLPPLRVRRDRGLALAGLMLACFGLVGVGLWPQYFYPVVWIAPVLILTSLQAVNGQPHALSGLARGDWRGVWLPALAALLCGVFWEMWNSRSLAHWVYSVPLVHGLLVFEMPLLGYAGYLPFGLTCAAVGALVCRQADRAS
jgi:hypothetical protein